MKPVQNCMKCTKYEPVQDCMNVQNIKPGQNCTVSIVYTIHAVAHFKSESGKYTTRRNIDCYRTG